MKGVYTCVTREGQSTSTALRTMNQRERTPRSEERFSSYMKLDSPRSSSSPTAAHYVPSLSTDDERSKPSRVEETRRTKKITIHETSERHLPTATRTSQIEIFL